MDPAHDFGPPEIDLRKRVSVDDLKCPNPNCEHLIEERELARWMDGDWRCVACGTEYQIRDGVVISNYRRPVESFGAICGSIADIDDGVVLHNPYYAPPRCKQRYSTGAHPEAGLYIPSSYGYELTNGCWEVGIKDGFCAEHHHQDTEYLQTIHDRLWVEYFERDREYDRRLERNRQWKRTMMTT